MGNCVKKNEFSNQKKKLCTRWALIRAHGLSPFFPETAGWGVEEIKFPIVRHPVHSSCSTKSLNNSGIFPASHSFQDSQSVTTCTKGTQPGQTWKILQPLRYDFPIFFPWFSWKNGWISQGSFSTLMELPALLLSELTKEPLVTSGITTKSLGPSSGGIMIRNTSGFFANGQPVKTTQGGGLSPKCEMFNSEMSFNQQRSPSFHYMNM